MLRLDPTLPILWVSPTTLQIGAQHAVVTLTDVDDDTALLLDRMRRGVVPAEPAVVLGDRRATALLAALAPALDDRARPRLRIEITGRGPVAETARRVLTEDGHRIARRRIELSVAVADWRLPDLERQRLLRRDRPHVPVVVGDQRIVIGPCTVPGRGACIRCAQLAAPEPPLPPGLPLITAVPAAAIAQAVAAIATTANLVATGALLDGTGATIALRTGELTPERWMPHAACGCGAPPGTARARAAGALRLVRATG